MHKSALHLGGIGHMYKDYRTGEVSMATPQKASLTPLFRISGLRKSPRAQVQFRLIVRLSTLYQDSKLAISPWTRFRQILGSPCVHQRRRMHLTKCDFETTTRLTGIVDPCGTRKGNNYQTKGKKYMSFGRGPFQNSDRVTGIQIGNSAATTQ